MNTASPFRFGTCELDGARRMLTCGGREVKMQPRVFDLLCYLVRHRDRVVPKDELLDALWPGTVVVDNALQRVVSLARAALAEAGHPEAVRTFSRHGYRFCVDESAEISEEEPTGSGVLGQARDACARNEWVAACEAYAQADAMEPIPADDVEEWGRAAICAGLGPSVIPALERVVAQRDAAGDTLGSARATLLLVQIRIDRNQGATARGLLQRAARYLDGQAQVAERGHFAWMSSRLALGSGDREAALAMADEACALGRSLRDPDVECLGLVYRGHALMMRGEVAAGLQQHEEAAAVIRLGGVRSWVAGWALCSVLYAARYRCDWLRAAQFAEAFSEWSRTSSMTAFPGTCQLHRAAVLGMQGDLERAAVEVKAAAELLSRVAPWAEGDAYCVLGEIQLDQGNIAEAEAAFRQAHALGWDPQPGLARMHLATGRPAQAARGLQLALQEGTWTLAERRGQMMCLLVVASVAAGDSDTARSTLAAIDAEHQLLANEALRAMHAVAAAEVANHDGDIRSAVLKLREAVRNFRESGSPVCEAEARIRLAECLAVDGDAAGVEMELHALEGPLAPFAALLKDRRAALRGQVAASAGSR